MQKLNETGPISQGLVISYFGSSVAVEDNNGQVFQCRLRRNQALPVVGDYVNWELGNDNTGIILSILPRKMELIRYNGRQTKPIAANVDNIVVVMAPVPIFSDYLVDRYLIAAELLNVSASIVLNKIDLLTNSKKPANLTLYEQIAYPVFLTSALTREGLDKLASHLKDKTSVLVGPSGVGKSSIINSLSKVNTIRVGDVTAKGAGKHTTTATRLYHLPTGGNLIDSPGVREFNLWPVTAQELLQGFKEFSHELIGCKFRDCSHLVEPGCAVQSAVSAGRISPARYASYQALMKENKHNK